MGPEELYEKGKKLLDFVETEMNKTSDIYKHESKIWHNGYIEAMNKIKFFIWTIFNKDE